MALHVAGPGDTTESVPVAEVVDLGAVRRRRRPRPPGTGVAARPRWLELLLADLEALGPDGGWELVGSAGHGGAGGLGQSRTVDSGVGDGASVDGKDPSSGRGTVIELHPGARHRVRRPTAEHSS